MGCIDDRLRPISVIPAVGLSNRSLNRAPIELLECVLRSANKGASIQLDPLTTTRGVFTMQLNSYFALRLCRRFAVAVALAPALVCVASPTTVVVTGTLQSEVGCASDDSPACIQSALAYDITDDVWQATFNLPAGNFSYFAALDGSFAVTYGANGKTAFDPISLNLAAARSVKFYYDDKTHWVTDNVNTPIVTLAGNLQSDLGCGSDFQPDCLRSWLQDIDGDGIYTLSAMLPDGNYSTVVTINESFDERYGAGGVKNGGNINFTVSGGSVDFCYNGQSHLLSFDAACRSVVVPGGTVPEQPTTALLAAAATVGILAMAPRRRRRIAHNLKRSASI